MNILLQNVVHTIGSITCSGFCVAIADNILKQKPPLFVYGIAWVCIALIFMYHTLRRS